MIRVVSRSASFHPLLAPVPVPTGYVLHCQLAGAFILERLVPGEVLFSGLGVETALLLSVQEENT